ncbi:MAG: terminase family protein [Sphingopyxis sp.]|nr:terminase family protein [Sphingopyxis sp.]
MKAPELAALPEAERAAWINRQTDKSAADYECDWSNWARPDQLPPPVDWAVWLLLAGRGFGKTRAGAEWVRAVALGRPGARIALVAETPAEARSVMVEGVSGLLNIGVPGERPEFESSLKRLLWPNGSVATLYGASDADSLRGPEHDFAWCDEVGKWPDAVTAWDNLMLTLRRGRGPQAIATTTPRGGPLLRRLVAETGVVVTRGRTQANRLNMDSGWVEAMERIYGGTRLGRQELDGELLEDAEGALWTRDLIERCRVAAAPDLRRVVVGVDPPASDGGDACGIIVVGKATDGKAYVLADHSVAAASPAEWARAVAAAAKAWQADRVVAEANQGGDMVVSTLLAADVAMPVKKVHAVRGKVARAEPVLTLYQAGKAFHAGAFAAVEDELCGLIMGGGYQGPGRSPDRADALVWAMTELMLQGGGAEPRLRQP